MNKFQLWEDAIASAENLNEKLCNLKASKDKLTPGEKRAIGAMQGKLKSFLAYGSFYKKSANPAKKFAYMSGGVK